MKLSAKARYGLRAITEIAKFYGGAPAKRKDIAEKQGLSDSGATRSGGMCFFCQKL
jgi:DNA-binding IscR family transcriptional regulator